VTPRSSRVDSSRAAPRRPAAAGTDLARRVAELLAPEVVLDEQWERFCRLLGDSFRADRVTLVLRGPEGDRVTQIEGGAARAPFDAKPEIGSVIAAVLATERSVRTRSALGAPLAFGRRLLGAIAVEGAEGYDASQATLFESCALFVGARIHDEEHRRDSERFQALAYTDALTGVANRRKFDETLADEWKRASRSGAPLTLVMVDIDFFKAFNDTYGHQAGDRCLQTVARTMRDALSRPGDLLARYGGEEFVALLPATPLEGGIALAEAFRAAVAAAAVTHAGSSLGAVSLSLGVASAVPAAGNARAGDLLGEADAALYRAKERGRNRAASRDYVSETEPALRTEGKSRGNLPALASRTIGRVREREELRDLVSNHRVVTVAGMGGSGKTRIAVALGGELLDEFADGAWFADLSAISEPSLVCSSIAGALGMHVPGDENGIAALAKALRRWDALLILDNCEHLVEPVAAIVAALVAECPGIRIVATSRAPLGVAGERTYRLPLLALPAQEAPTAAQAAEYDAVCLFVERAKGAKPSFELTDANAPAVVQVCRQVEGIALAIELVAPRLAVVTVERLAQRLVESFGIVSSARRTTQERHQTMRALIDWSHELLSEAERRLFRRLSTFAGGWTLETAAATCVDDRLDPFDLFDLHASLLDKSLVVDDASSASPRFRFLEPVREYAREMLDDSGEGRDAALRHAECFAELAARADEDFYTTPSRDWFARVQSELGNYRAALAWCVTLGNAPELGASIAGSLSWYFYYSSPSEGVRWIDAALSHVDGGRAPALEARLQLALVPLYGLPPAKKRAAGERAAALYRSLGDPARLSHALRMLGLTMAWYYPGERAAAERLIDEAGAIAASLDDPIARALVLQARSQVLEAADHAGRHALISEAYDLLREHGNDRQISVALTDLSECAFAEGREDEAFAHGREALRVAVLSGSRNTMLCAGINLAHYAAATRDWETACDAADRALRWADEAQAPEFVTFSINAIGCIAAAAGDASASARLLGFCNARFGSLHTPRHEGMCEDVLYRRALDALRAELGAAALDRELAAGALLTEDEAVEEARRIIAAPPLPRSG
jgi:diguanylate cyclase (GGDEF)-like protein